MNPEGFDTIRNAIENPVRRRPSPARRSTMPKSRRASPSGSRA